MEKDHFLLSSPNHDYDDLESLDFTFDVSSLFAKHDAEISLPAESEKKEKDFKSNMSEMEETDFTFDMSGILPSPEGTHVIETYTEMNASSQSPQPHDAEPEIINAEDFIIDHEENIQTIYNDLDYTDCFQSSESKQSKRKRKCQFKKSVQHTLAAFSSICSNNCEPYVASVCINEQLYWMDNRKIIKELPFSFVKKFYNVNYSNKLVEYKYGILGECRNRFSHSPGNMLYHQKHANSSSNLKRVVNNEIVLCAEDSNILTENDIELINQNTLNFINKLFQKLSHLKLYSHKKKHAIDQKTALKVCLSLFNQESTKNDFLGELVHQNPSWKHGNKKYKSYKRDLAIHTQLDGLGTMIKHYFYAKNRLIKDMRLSS